MPDIFAELMAFLFAKNKRENPMRPNRSNQLLTHLRQHIHATTEQKEEQ